MKNFFMLLIGVSIMTAFSCKKPKASSSIPELSYLDYIHYYDINKKDTTGLFKFYFTDGDGDIGMQQSDAGVDFYSTLYHKVNGVWVNDSLNYNFRLPYLVGQGSSSALKGEIDITYNKIIITSIAPDSVKFQVYIVDRAGNQSKPIFTPEIDLK